MGSVDDRMPKPWKSDRHDEFYFLKILLVVIAGVVVVAGLIEWNARRQAAAMTRELLRPATPEEMARINHDLKQMEAQMMRDAAHTRGRTERTERYGSPEGAMRPLREDERCIEGKRFKRLENGWASIGAC